MHAVVTEVEVRTIPFTVPQEDRPWDLFSGPDLCYEVHGPDGTRLHVSDATDDVRPSDLPVTLEGEVVLEDSGPHVLRLLDEDLTENEVVARIAFEPRRLAEVEQGPEPPSCVQFEDGDTTLRLILTWK